MRRNILIEVKEFVVLAGTDIQEAINEAIELAKRYDCIIRISFNGWKVDVHDFSDEKQLVDMYFRYCHNDSLKFPEIYKMDIL